MDKQFEVLSPWAEVDPLPLRGISPRVTSLKGKKIGLFANSKRASSLILSVLGKKLRDKLPDADFVWYMPREKTMYHITQLENEVNRPVFQEWVRGVDTIIGAIGD